MRISYILLGFIFLVGFQIVLSQKIQPVIPINTKIENDIYRKINHILDDKSVEGIKAFIYQNFTELKETNSKIELFSQIESPYGIHVLFHQHFDDILIYDAGIKINLNKEYKILNALNYLKVFEPKLYGSYDYNIELFVEPQRNRLAGNPEFDIQVTKVAFVIQGKLRLAYRVRTQMDNEYSAQEWLIDGETGAILHHQILAAFITQLDTTGRGLVFIPDPLTKAGVTYGGSYVDNNDADVPVINQQRDTVILKNITFSNGVFKLEGPFVKITEFESPVIQPVTSNDGNFYFGRASSGFEDVNAYYHLDSMQRYIQSLGFNNLANFQILVDTHSNFGQDNSYYTSSPSPRIAFGEGGVDDAEDADVIVHEYGHALSESGSPGSNSGTQRQGQDEGIGDYIAASYSRGIKPFNWFNIFNWDGHNTYWNGRKCNITAKYPNITGNFYNYGELWCTVLMQVWGIVGKETSDKVFFQHLYMNSANQTLRDAANLILDADTMLFGGTNSLAYLEAFCEKQILTDNRCSMASSINIFSEHLFKIYPNPATYELHLQNINHLSNTQVYLFNLLGQEVYKKSFIHFDEQIIDLQDFNNGIYILQIYSGNKMFTDKIIVNK